jgi:ureidoglycolate lyase
MKEVKVRILNQRNFKPFGIVIEPPSTKPAISNMALDYWGALARLDIDKPQVSFLIVKKREFILNQIERHVKLTEVFIPLKGTSVFPVAPPKNVENLQANVPVDEVTAFLLNGGKGIVMKKGTWHWPPFPITEEATFAVILAADTIEKDLDIRDVNPPIKICF